ncbi:MAG: hypothetical protein COA71_07995 [SAR86 cluster bacterium]|uniref:DUF454 domain-containing protein n=1 Tax=SAR86 cluster bacterium TaxID=2030880 RepID=A0A2A5CDE9_9GAMM|nr:DUF454 family protein [Gammaproteobacteria bacterium AH-315-E17]PCJ41490.1 MAG: hypothetical protein COA71_07995 [SAR86 cluster bacterium]
MHYRIPEEKQNSSRLNNLLAKILAGFFVLICLAVGIVGLILPIIPGLLFLSIAAMITARHSPSLDRWFRKNRIIRGYLDSGEGFLNLSWLRRIQFILWLCLKIFIDTIVMIFALIAGLLTFSVKKYQSYR